jgi:hypothetical protein
MKAIVKKSAVSWQFHSHRYDTLKKQLEADESM